MKKASHKIMLLKSVKSSIIYEENNVLEVYYGKQGLYAGILFVDIFRCL